MHKFHIAASVCGALNDYLAGESNRDTNGFLFRDGQPWPGYAKYDLVHAEFGCVSRLQHLAAENPIATSESANQTSSARVVS